MTKNELIEQADDYLNDSLYSSQLVAKEIIRNMRDHIASMGDERCVPDKGEPSFVLLGRDPQAPELVEKWALDRRNCEPNSDKPSMAYAIAKAMREYKDGNPDKGMGYGVWQARQGDEATQDQLIKDLTSIKNLAYSIEEPNTICCKIGDFVKFMLTQQYAGQPTSDKLRSLVEILDGEAEPKKGDLIELESGGIHIVSSIGRGFEPDENDTVAFFGDTLLTRYSLFENIKRIIQRNGRPVIYKSQLESK